MCLCFFSLGEEASEKASHGRPFPSRSVEGSALCRDVKKENFCQRGCDIFEKSFK
jgi:hypothetical protein